jgi:hypothetical protein
MISLPFMVAPSLSEFQHELQQLLLLYECISGLDFGDTVQNTLLICEVDLVLDSNAGHVLSNTRPQDG